MNESESNLEPFPYPILTPKDKAFARLIAFIGYSLFRLNPTKKISSQSKDNAAALDCVLSTKSAILVAYHPPPGKLEAIIGPYVLKYFLPHLKHTFGPAKPSLFTDPTSFAWFTYTDQYLSTTFIPTVRNDQDDDIFSPYREYFRSQLFEHTKQSLPQPGNVYALTPRGKRSELVTPENINPSFIKLALYYSLPVTTTAIYFHGFRLNIIFGPPQYPDPIQASKGSDDYHSELLSRASDVMRTLAESLPPDKSRGF